MIKKSSYLHEKRLGQNRFLMNTLTFDYIILNVEDSFIWSQESLDSFHAMDAFEELLDGHYLVEDDNMLIDLIIDLVFLLKDVNYSILYKN